VVCWDHEDFARRQVGWKCYAEIKTAVGVELRHKMKESIRGAVVLTRVVDDAKLSKDIMTATRASHLLRYALTAATTEIAETMCFALQYNCREPDRDGPFRSSLGTHRHSPGWETGHGQATMLTIRCPHRSAHSSNAASQHYHPPRNHHLPGRVLSD
jgi:hypothetical protein